MCIRDRGKPLTPFENFKAKLEQKVKFFDGEWPKYDLTLGDKTIKVDGYKYFIHKIDTDWADVFWPYRNALSKDNTFDDELMNFISLVIANHHLLNSDKADSRTKIITDKLFGDKGRLENLSFHDYDELGCITQDTVLHLIQTLDLIQNGKAMPGGLSAYQDGIYYSEENSFKKVISDTTSYPEKLRFYAFYSYLASGKDPSGLQDWLRVIYNLTENRIINGVDEYRNALKAISLLSKDERPVLEQLIDGCEIDGFEKGQVLEEKIKANLIVKSNDWRSAIVDAEKHSFFRGQIGFLLKFSGIIDFYFSNKNCDWDESSDKENMASFVRYYRSTSAVFDLVKEGSETIDYLWERSVLSKGKYFTGNDSTWNLLSSNGSGKNVQRDHSWRRLLRLPLAGDIEWTERQGYVKKVLDDTKFKSDDVKGTLTKICEDSIESGALELWRKNLIKYPELFQLSRQGYIAMNENEIVLLHESQRNHMQSELFSRALYIELQKQPFDFSPFGRLSYNAVRSSGDTAYAILGNWCYSDNEYSIDIWYEDDAYHFLFYSNRPGEFSRDLKSILAKNNLTITTNYPEYESDNYIYSCNVSCEVLSCLMALCSDLKELASE